jgi:hypothetical protein
MVLMYHTNVLHMLQTSFRFSCVNGTYEYITTWTSKHQVQQWTLCNVVPTIIWHAPNSLKDSTVSPKVKTTEETNQTTSRLLHNLNIFGAWTNHMHTHIHKIHHSPNLGETTTFPLIVFFGTGHEGCTQMSFFLKLPSWESWNSWNWDSCHFKSP